MVRTAKDDEIVVRFLFQKGHFNSSFVRKNGITVDYNPDNQRFELSVYLLNELPTDKDLSDGEFWEIMPVLGQRPDSETAKAYGSISADTVRSLGLNVEVNHKPNKGHCDIINWSDDQEERMEQALLLGKKMKTIKRPK